MGDGDGHGVMLDPSFVLSEEGAAFLSAGAEGGIERFALSRSFFDALESGNVPDVEGWFPEEGPAVEPSSLREALAGAQLFGYDEAEVEEPRVAEVREGLRGELDPMMAEILADQWVFLQTQSWITSKLRYSFDVMSERGAEIKELPRKVGRKVIERTLKKKELPERVPLGMAAQAGAKWFAVGGSAVGSLLLPPGAPLFTAATGAFFLLDP